MFKETSSYCRASCILPVFFFLLDYELIRLLKAITTVFEYLGQINQAEQSHRKTTSLCPLSS